MLAIVGTIRRIVGFLPLFVLVPVIMVDDQDEGIKIEWKKTEKQDLSGGSSWGPLSFLNGLFVNGKQIVHIELERYPEIIRDQVVYDGNAQALKKDIFDIVVGKVIQTRKEQPVHGERPVRKKRFVAFAFKKGILP